MAHGPRATWCITRYGHLIVNQPCDLSGPRSPRSHPALCRLDGSVTSQWCALLRFVKNHLKDWYICCPFFRSLAKTCYYWLYNSSVCNKSSQELWWSTVICLSRHTDQQFSVSNLINYMLILSWWLLGMFVVRSLVFRDRAWMYMCWRHTCDGWTCDVGPHYTGGGRTNLYCEGEGYLMVQLY